VQYKQESIAPDNSEEQKESFETEYAVDPAELVDRTIQGQTAEPQGYAGANGSVIEKSEENGNLIVKRKFEGRFKQKTILSQISGTYTPNRIVEILSILLKRHE